MRAFEKLPANNVRKSPMRSLFICAVLLMLLSSLLIAANKATVCYISPVPGSKYLSPSTNIIIRTIGKLDPSMFDDPSFLSVSGSESGRHPGHLSLSEDGSAFFFVPESPFTAGERVTVRTSNRFRTREGFVVDPLNFHFEIGQLFQSSLLSIARPEYAPPEIGNDLGKIIYGDHSHLNSSSQNGGIPDDCPLPIVTQLANPASGCIFIGTYKTGKPGYHLQYVTYINSDRQYLMILNDKGVPQYWKEVANMNTDFKPQPNGHFTYYDFSINYYLELDSSLNVVDAYKCGNGYSTNPHELRCLKMDTRCC